MHLSLQSSSAPVRLIQFASTTVSQVEFGVFAKNGDSSATTTFSDGTASTFTIENNVSTQNGQPNDTFTHVETVAAPQGKEHLLYLN
jgi:hypothetical protein